MLRTRNVLRRVCIPAQLQSLFVGDDLFAAWDTSWALHHKAAALALRDGAARSSTVSQRSTCSARGYSAEAWRSSRVSGAASFPYGRAAEMRASQAARGPERGADGAGTRAEDEEDEDVDARAEDTRRRILEAALRHVVRISSLRRAYLRGAVRQVQVPGTSELGTCVVLPRILL
jgi:hypothetical protein